jgi:hypothetical protein
MSGWFVKEFINDLGDFEESVLDDEIQLVGIYDVLDISEDFVLVPITNYSKDTQHGDSDHNNSLPS